MQLVRSILERAVLLTSRGLVKDLLALLFLVGIVLVFLWPSLFLDETLLPVDILLHFSPWCSYSNRPPVWNGLPVDAITQFYPWKLFTAQAIRGGTIPLWNPYVMSGTPFMANSQAAIFYPFNFLFLLFPALRAYAVFVALHLFLAGSFTYFYLRAISVSRAGSLLGGMAFMSSPFLIGWSEHLSHLGVMVWLPLSLILVERMLIRKSLGYALGLGIVLGVQTLSGMFQFSFFALLAVVAYYLFRTLCLLRERASLKEGGAYLLLMAIAAIVAFSLSAVQLLPSLEASEHLIRAGTGWRFNLGQFFMPGAMSFSYLITLLEPNFLGPQSTLHSLGSRNLIENAYIGVLPLLLASVNVFNLKKRYPLFFFILALLAVSLALGTPLYQVLLFLIPKFGLFRAPWRALYLEVFALSVLAGLGFDFLVGVVKERRSSPSPWALAIAWLIPLTGVVLMVNRVTAGSLDIYPGTPPPLPYALRQTLILLLFFSLSLAVLLLFLRRVIGFRLFMIAALAITAVDLVGQNLWYYPALDYDQAYFPTASTEFLQEHLGLYRIARYGTEFLESPLAPNTAMVYGLFDVQGSDIYILEDYVAFLNLIEDHGLEAAWLVIPNIEEEISLDSPLIDLLGVKYILTTSEIGMDKYELVFDGQGRDIKIYENKEVLPRAFVVHRVEVVAGDEEALVRLGSGSFDPGQVVIVGQELPTSEVAVNEEAPLKDNSKAQIINYGLNAVIIEAQAENPGFLVLTDVYYPGWRVFVDGQERQLYRADYIFRAVYLEAGNHQVRFVFEPLSFKMGLYLVLFALLASVIAIGCGLVGGKSFRVKIE